MAAGAPPVPPGAGGPPSGGGGGGVPPSDYNTLVNGLNQAASSIADNTRNLEGLKEVLSKFPGIADDVSKKFQKAGMEMKGIVALADSASDAMKGMSDYTKTLAKGLSTSRNAKDMKATLDAIVQASQKALSTGLFSAQGSQQLNKRISQASAMAKELENNLDEALDENRHQKYLNFLKQITREGEKAADVFSRMTMDRFSQSIVTTKRALVDAGLMKGGYLEKWTGYAAAGVKMKDAAKAKSAQNRQDFQQKRDEAEERLSKIRGLNIPKTPQGRIDWGQAASYQAMGYTKRQASALANAQDTEPGGESAMAKILMAGGGGQGGSMIKGLTGSGLIEGGAGMVSELLGKLAVPLAIIEGLKDLWDRNAQMNKDVESTLGAGGIFTGGGGGMTNMDVTRMNLTPQNLASALYNRLGLGFERNLKMAGAIVQSGYNVEDLTQMGGAGMGLTGSEFAGGNFGRIQQTAAVQGRILGMGDAASVETYMKLLMQYRESMEGAQDFFINVEKDSRAAGVSATKYISIIEGITDSFSRFNKSVDDVAATMRMLGSTGRETAEDLQDNLKLLYGTNRQEDTGKGVFLFQQMQQGGGAQIMQKRLQESFQRQASNVTQSLSDLGMNMDQKDVTDMLSSPNGQVVLRNMMTDFMNKHPNLARRDVESANAAVNAAVSTQHGLAGATALAHGGNAMDIYGQFQAGGLLQNPQVALSMTQAFAQQMMKRGGMSPEKMFMEGGQGSTMLTTMLSDFFLGDKQAAQKFQQMMQDTAQQRLGAIEQSPAGSAAAVKQLLQAMPELRGDMKPGESTQDALTRWSKDKRYGGKITYLLSGMDGGFNDLFNTNSDLAKAMSQGDIAKQKDQDLGTARQIGGATQTIEDVVKNIIPALFNKAIGILEEIYGFFAHSSFFGGVSADDEKQAKAVMDQKDNSDLIANASTLIQKKIGALESLRAQAPDDQQAAISKQIVDLQAQNTAITKKFGVNTGMGNQQAIDTISSAEDALTNLNQPIQDIMSSIGAQATEPGGAGTGGYYLTDDQFAKVKDKITSFEAQGLAKDTTVTDANGQTKHLVQTTNNFYSVDFAKIDAAKQSMVDAQEQSTVQPPM